ncbi:DUF1212-domain-containing protein [Mytilinidion resinicola]|uniref:DUF1212-domain-containing protein n=1 Tax=Mytilinidion resinicola TaxID=574789 RepID=A0A6A6YJU6_9PEZI|nr:DUF1212-domain-containing protein [Mytilinidion resinicola]KAF2809060.1 DUF1212-domain-containing protein [Mytilinidion resinicola]
MPEPRLEPPPKPRPAIRKGTRTPPVEFFLGDDLPNDANVEKRRSGIEAQIRATRLAQTLGSNSAPGSRRSSAEFAPPAMGSQLRRFDNIPLTDYGGTETPGDLSEEDEAPTTLKQKEFLAQADHLLRQNTSRVRQRPDDFRYIEASGLASGQITPTNELEPADTYVPVPSKYRTGILGTLLKANGNYPSGQSSGGHQKYPSDSFSGASTAANTPEHSPPISGASTPGTSTPLNSHHNARHWYSRSSNNSSNELHSSISKLVESSTGLASPVQRDLGEEVSARLKHSKHKPPMGKRTKSATSIASAFSRMSKSSRDEQIKIKIHLAGTLARQQYLRKLCKALMKYGAPTHRLEEYMNMSARVLEIEAQFLYIPDCMIISFDDSSVHTTEVKLVRTAQGVDLGKLRDTHEIYKDVLHDRIGVEEATPRLEDIINRKAKYSPWFLVPVYGLASASVGPFAFQARWIDLPIAFLLGCLLGWLQLIVSPQNEMISNVFEISAAVMTSFLARGFGSIRGGNLFCFSALAQSSIALILPGFTVLSASLELQSRHIVAGSVRMVYAIIYSLFLGFGITIGTVLFGLAMPTATSATTCENPLSSDYYPLFVFAFTLCLLVINQAKWKQAPAMLFISLAGYVVNFHSSKRFAGNAQVSNTLGALTIGVLANLHARLGRYVDNWFLDRWESTWRPKWRRTRKRFSRRHPWTSLNPFARSDHKKSASSEHAATWAQSSPPLRPAMGARLHSDDSSVYQARPRKVGYGLAAAAMLPAIFVQVPSGLSVSGSLVSGITSADQITRNATGVTTVANATVEASGGTSINSVAFTVGFSVVQVAIGITVGLFLAALLVYPVGKRRSGLFSF